MPIDPTGSDTPEHASTEEYIAALPPAYAKRVRDLVAQGDQRTEGLQRLQQVAVALSRSLDEEVVWEEVARGVERTMRAGRVTVVTLDGPDDEIRIKRGVAVSVTPRVGQGVREALRSGELRQVDVGPHTDPTLVAPLTHGRRPLGAIIVEAGDKLPFDPEAPDVLATIAAHAAAAIRNAQLYSESERERRQSDAMSEIARAVGESLRMGEVLRLIMRHASGLLRADGACVALRDHRYLQVASALGIAEVLAGVFLPVDGPLLGRVVTSGEPAISNAVADDEVAGPQFALLKVRKALAVPLAGSSGVVGVLAVFNRAQDFDVNDVRILRRLGEQVGVAVVNARLFENVQAATREWTGTFDALGVGMAVVDDDGKILRSNARARHLAGAETPMGVNGRSFFSLYLADAPEDEVAPLQAAIRDGIQLRRLCRGVWRGEVRLLSVHTAPHPNGGAVLTFDEPERGV